MSMVKKRYIWLFFLLLVPNGSVFAADIASQLKINVGQYSENIPQASIDGWISHSASFSFDKNYRSEFENISFCPSSVVVCSLGITPTQRIHTRYSSMVKIDEGAVKSYIEDLARKVNRDPVEAKFKVENGVVTAFGESQNGINLEVYKSVQAITDALKKNKPTASLSLDLPFESKKPATSYGDVNNLGISSLIGEGTSNFKGSPKNRIFNIKVATNRFNGILIKPGEEFSFVSILGEVDAEHGYLPELVIKNNVTEPEFGGGICQVSTTAFRAAIYSGLEITARKNHAYPVSYYNPQGMDSTVYIPRPDLRFKNNTPGYILIQTKIEGTVLTFDFYGTDDGRKTTVDGPTITEKQPDGALKASFTQHVINKNGDEFINDIFNSSYNSPYKYPHPGGPVLTAKPSNWSEDEWKSYKKIIKDMAKAADKKTS